MATAMTGAQMLAACRKWGVNVHELAGYSARRAGAWSNVEGIMIHHVGSDASQSDSYLNFLFIGGRADVPAPLCNVATQMDGDLWLGAMGGRANHAGMGSGVGAAFTMVANEDYKGYETGINPGPDTMNGNAHFYGNECCFDGGQPMTAAMYRSMILWCAAVCDFHGWTALRVIGHKEWTQRKIDPGSTNMVQVRRDVRTAMEAGPGGDMSQQDVDLIKAYIDLKFAQTFGAGGTETGRYEQIIGENRSQTATMTAATNAIIAWLNNDEIEEDFADKLAGDRWKQGTDEGRQQAAAILADAQAKYVESQAKIDAGLADLAVIKEQTAPPVVEPPLV